MHGLTVYVKEGLPFAWDLSLENCRFLLIFSTDYTSLSVLLLFLLLTTFLSLCMVFDSISSNIDEVLSINQSANVFFFGDFNEHHKDLLTNSGRTEDLVISNDLTQMVNLPTRIRGCHSLCPPLWISFFLLMLVFVLQWLYLHLEILIMFLSQFPWTFHHIHNGMPCFIELLMTIIELIGMVFAIIWEMFYGKISFNPVLLLLLANFVSGFRLELKYISLTHLHVVQLLVLLP